MRNFSNFLKIFTSLFLLTCFDMQAQIVWTNLTTKTLNKCSGQDTFRIQVQNKTGASISTVTIRPTLPSGVSIVSNSIIDSTSVFPGGNGGITWNGTDFVIANAMPNLAQLDFYFVVKASCAASTGSLTNTYALRSSGTQVSVTGTSDPFTVKSAVLSITALDSTVITNKIIGYSFPQKIKITNGGQGLIDSFNINLVNTAVTISNLQVVGGSAVGTATLSSTGIASVYPATSFGQNQSIELTYTVTLAKCTPTSRSITAYWGCGGSTCQTSSAVISDFSIQNTVTMSVKGSETTPTNSCLINLNRTYETVYKNTSNAPIKLRQLYFGQANDGQSYMVNSWSQTDYIDMTSVYVIPPASSGVAPYYPTSNYVRADGLSGAYNQNGITICNNGKAITAKVHFGLAAVAANDTTFLLSPGDSIIVRYNRIQCDNTVNSCNGKASFVNWVARSGQYYYIANDAAYANFYDQCSNTVNAFSLISTKTYLHNSVNITNTEVPAQVVGAGNFSYVGSYYMNAQYNPGTTKRYYQADLKLPPGVTYVANSYAAISVAGLEPGYPKYTPSGGGGILSLRFAFSGSNSISPNFKLTLHSDGTSCGNQLLQTNITAVVDSSCGNMYSSMCYNDTIDFVCPVNCTSTFPNSLIYERQNVGLPDTNNDGYADINAVLDRNKISTNYLRGGDTFRSYSKNVVYVDSNNFTSWALMQADHKFDTGSWRPAGNPNITLIRGNNTYSINGINTIIGTKNRDFVVSWASNLPPGWTNYQSGDTVIIEQNYVFQMNSRDAPIFNTILNCKFTGTAYMSQGSIVNANYTYNNSTSNKYSCLSTKYNLKLVGHTGAYFQNNISLSNGCTNNLSYQVYALQDQSNAYNFPYEYRPTMFADTIIVTIPTGYTFAKTTGLGFSQQVNPSIAQLDSCRLISGNKLYYFVKNAREKTINPYPNESSNAYVNFELTPNNNCYAYNFPYNTTVKYRFFDYSYNKVKDSIENFISSGTIVDVNKPVLTANAIPSTQSPSSGTATYKLDITNSKSQASTAKVWVYFKNSNNNASISNVKFNNILQTPNAKGYYTLSTIGANSTISVYADLSLQSCNASQVVAYYGLECNAPTTTLDSISCKDSFVLTINPVSADYQATLYPLNGGSNYDFCNPFTVEYEVSSTVLGDIKNVVADVTLPNGISYVPNSVQFKIPSNAASYTSSSYNPTQSGSVLHFDLTKNSGSGINTDSLMKGVYDITKNTIKVRYQVKSSCGANEGETIKHTFSAKKSCGDALTPIISETVPMVFSNLVGPGYTTDPSKSKIDTISNCISTDLYVNILNLGALPSQGLDSIRITLPYTARYVGYVNSGANTKNAPASNPTIKYNSDSSSVLSWQMSNNISKDDSILFIVQIKPSPILKTFQNSNILIATGRSMSLSCNSVTCDIFKLNGYSSIPLVIKSLPTISAFTGDSFICKNEVTTISNSSTGGVWSSANTSKAIVSNTGVVTPVDTGKVYIKYAITNSGSCTNTDSVKVTIDSVPYVASITGDNEVCIYDSSQLSIASIGGTWYSSDTSVANISSSGMVTTKKPGSTTIKYVGAKSSKGCYDSTSIVFTVDSLPTLTITDPAAVCYPSTVDLTASAITTGSVANASGSLMYTYWSDSAANTAISAPNTSSAIQDSGRYYIKATNSNSCSVVKGVAAQINKLPALTIINPSAICAPGTIDLTASAITTGSLANASGSLTYTYWSDSAASSAISAPNTSSAIQDSGRYYIKATNSNSCSVVKGVVAQIYKLPTLTITNPTAVCLPNTIDLTASVITTGSVANASGSLTYTYWSDSAASSAISAPNTSSAIKDSGRYFIKATNSNSCSVVKGVAVQINKLPTLTIVDPSAICAPGTIDLTASAITTGSVANASGSLTYTYWSDSSANTAISAPNTSSAIQDSGRYYIKATNSNACSVVKGVAAQINKLPTLTIVNPSAICAPGTIDLTASAITTGSVANASGSLTYTYWSDSVASSAISAPNTSSAIQDSARYFIKATNSNSCSVVKGVVAQIYKLPTLTITNPTAVCAPGTIDLTASAITTGSLANASGSLTYTYWSDSAASSAISAPNTSSAIQDSGRYYIKATNSNSCSVVKGVAAQINKLPSLTIVNPTAVCAPGTIDLTASAITTGSVANASGSLTYTYWSDSAASSAISAPNTSIAIQDSGRYYIKATNSNSCSVVKGVAAIINKLPELTITDPAAVCYPSTINLTASAITTGSVANASGSLTYTYWSDSAANTAISAPNTSSAIQDSGRYYIKATNSNSCSVVKGVAAQINKLPTLTIVNPSAICAPGTIDLTASAITTGSVANASGSLTYTYWSDSAASSAISAPNTSSAIQDSGRYYIKATNSNSCSVVKGVAAQINKLPTLTIVNPSAICAPGTIDLTASAITTGSVANASGSLTYTYWSDSAASSAISAPNTSSAIQDSGRYYIKATNSNSCSVVKGVAAQIYKLPTLTITNPTAVCLPNTIDLTASAITTGSVANASGSLTYTYWSDSAANTAISAPNTSSAIQDSGRYYIKATNSNACSVVKGVAAQINKLPVLTVTNPTAVCYPSTIDLTASAVTTGSVANASGSLTYTYWSDSAANTAISAPNTSSAIQDSARYFIKATNSNSCSVVKGVAAIINKLPVLTVTDPAAVCYPSTIDITASGVTTGSVANASGSLTYTYWSDSSANTAISAPNSSSAIQDSARYFIKATNSNSCSVVKGVAAIINKLPELTITDPAAVCYPSTINLTASAITTGSVANASGSLTYTYWSDSSANTAISAPNSSSSIQDSARYFIKATNSNSCSEVKGVAAIINKLPELTITDPSAVCYPSTIDLTASGVTTGSVANASGSLTYTYWSDSSANTAISAPNTSSAIQDSARYFIKATNSNSCSVVKGVAAVINKLPVLTVTDPSAVCYPSTINLTASAITTGSVANASGSLTYTYWSDSSANTAISAPNTSSAIQDSARYFIKATNSNSCSVVKGVAAIINKLPVLTVTDPAAVCYPSTINLTASAITTGSVANASGSLTYTYWSDSSANTAISAPNTSSAIQDSARYFIKATNSNSCSVVKGVAAVVNKLPILAIIDPAAVCYPSTIDLTASGVTTGSVANASGSLTYTYWSDSAANTAISSPNTSSAIQDSARYFIKATNSNSCSVVKGVAAVVNKLPVLTVTDPTAVCYPNTIDLTASAVTTGSVSNASGSLTYTYWSDSSANIAISAPNTSSAIQDSARYFIKATNSNSCSVVKGVAAIINKLPVLTVTDPAAVCYPSTIDLTASAVTTGSVANASGSLTYTYWSDSSTNTAISAPNTSSAIQDSARYFIKATNSNSCSVVKGVAAVINKLPLELNFDVINQTCDKKTGTIIIKNRQANTLYSVDSVNYFAKDTFDQLFANTYKIYAKNQNNCQITFANTAKIDSIERPGLILSQISGDSVVVKGSIIQYTIDSVRNATSYSWSIPNTWTPSSGSMLNTNVISVKVGDSSGNIIVTAYNKLCSSNIVLKFITVISDKEDTLKVVSYMDSLKKVNISYLSNYQMGGYTVSYVNGNAPKNGSINLSNVDAQGNIVYTPNAGFIGIDSAEIIICKNGNCKKVFIYFNVIPYFNPRDFTYNNYNITLSQNSEAKIPVITTASNTYFKISKSPSNGSVTIDSVSGKIIYNKPANFCGTDSIEVIVRYEFSNSNIAPIEYKYWVYIINHCDNSFPNFISPNGDGTNDKFVIPSGFRNQFPKMKICIYNRWGNIVWRSKGVYNDDFDGTNHNGDIIPDGVYYYIIELEDHFTAFHTGFIQIMRD